MLTQFTMFLQRPICQVSTKSILTTAEGNGVSLALHNFWSQKWDLPLQSNHNSSGKQGQ